MIFMLKSQRMIKGNLSMEPDLQLYYQKINQLQSRIAQLLMERPLNLQCIKYCINSESMDLIMTLCFQILDLALVKQSSMQLVYPSHYVVVKKLFRNGTLFLIGYLNIFRRNMIRFPKSKKYYQEYSSLMPTQLSKTSWFLTVEKMSLMFTHSTQLSLMKINQVQQKQSKDLLKLK